MPYRIAESDRMARLLDAYDTVRSREHALSEFFWESAERIARGGIAVAESVLAPESARRLVAQREAWKKNIVEAGAIAKWNARRQDDALTQLEAYRAALDAAIGSAAVLESALGRVDDDEIPEPSFRWHPWPGAFPPSVTREICTFALAHDDEPRIAREGSRSVLRFSDEDMPVLLTVISPAEAQLAAISPDVAMRTSVSHLAPRIRVRPARWGDAVFASLGRRDFDLGAEDLDSLLHVVASPEARPILGSERFVRAMRVLARRDVPSVIVENGLATVRWRFEPDRDALDAALNVLRLVRGRLQSCRLLRVG